MRQKTAWRLAVLTAFALLAVFRGAAPAQEPRPGAADPVIEQLSARTSYFLERISAKDEQNAFDELLEGSQLSKKTVAVQSLVEKAGQLQEKYGDYQESEQISAKRIGHDLVLMRYLFKCKNFPVVWYVTYYRDFNSAISAGDEEQWVVISVRFDTQLELLGISG